MAAPIIVKPLSLLVDISAGANTVSNATLVYIHCDTTDATITLNDGTSNVATLVVGGNQEIVIEKEPSWTIQSSASAQATKIAFRG